ncbi:tail fiber protein [Roseiarcaceae bacterium H3SJ34-1]|uniref:phage tail protein n=1 Tax=Terripilifer ovatus TaxID=3032367 RepID=UPI003AB931DB|nr:tail fiber protein [Roseiarcaceae bacterium H3SJ34-1]
MKAAFSSPWALTPTDQRREPTSDEIAHGFPCGPPDRELFNELFYRLSQAMKEIENVITAGGLTPNDSLLNQMANSLDGLVGARVAPTGIIAPFAGATAPTGWLLCYGQAISRTTYASLFGVISTAYGVGDGSTTFNVPDLRGRVIAGRDDMGGVAATRLTSATISGGALVLGKTGGEERHQLTISELANHNHALTDPGHTHPLPQTTGAGSGQALAVSQTPTTAAAATGSATTGITLAATGGDTPHNNVQPTIIGNYIIRI